MENEIWMWLLPIILLPVFFAMGWFAARVDMKTVLKQAKRVPVGYYKASMRWSTATAAKPHANWPK